MSKVIEKLSLNKYNNLDKFKKLGHLSNMFKKATEKLMSLLIAATLALFTPVAVPVKAAVSQPAPTAQVSFTFDDGTVDALTLAAPILTSHGITGTAYIPSGCIETTEPCELREGKTFLTWDQVKQLKDQYGWEIGGHAHSHPLMTELDDTNLAQEVELSHELIKANTGIDAKAFATPYGDYNSKVEAAIAKYYTSHRGFHDIDFNDWPHTPYLLHVQQVQGGSAVPNCGNTELCVTVDQVKDYIDQAKANNTWLILVFHTITNTPSNNTDDYEYSTSELNEIAAYVKAQNVKTVNISDGLVSGTDNLLPEVDLKEGACTDSANLLDKWCTDSPAAVTADTNGNGNAPEATNSLKVVTSPSGKNHIFSPQVAVSPTDTYVIQGYVDIQGDVTFDVASGLGLDIYIDEYDAAGTWISGGIKQTIANSQFKDIAIAYTASSASVASASLQIIMNFGAAITTYLDSFGWFNTSNSAPATKPGDINNDNTVDALDLSIVLNNWDQSGLGKAQGNINGDSVVDALDLSIVLNNWSY